MTPNLIFDVGMNDGSDSSYYLRKGFKVVAIEANRFLCESAHARYGKSIDEGRLKVLNVGISNKRGQMEFSINTENSEWSSFVPLFAERAKSPDVVKVECVLLDDILEEYGTPYYLKVDIEGCDEHCIAALERRGDLPKYVSTEATVGNFGPRMQKIGYTRFKMINQQWNMKVPHCKPAKEGNYVDQTFIHLHSGPFGDETYGPWLTLEEFERERKMAIDRTYEGSIHQKLGCPPDIFEKRWYDFHAAL